MKQAVFQLLTCPFKRVFNADDRKLSPGADFQANFTPVGFFDFIDCLNGVVQQIAENYGQIDRTDERKSAGVQIGGGSDKSAFPGRYEIFHLR